MALLPGSLSRIAIVLLCMFPCISTPLAKAEIQIFRIEKSSESWVSLGKFWFTNRGRLLLNVSHLAVYSPEKAIAPDTYSMGFLLARKEFLQEIEKTSAICPLTSQNVTKLFSVLDMEGPKDAGERPMKSILREVAKPGEYRLYFVNCAPTRFVSADVSVVMYNEGTHGDKYFLSSGLIYLTIFHSLTALGFGVILIVWLLHVKKIWFQTVTPLAFHLYLTLLLAVNIALHIFLAGKLVSAELYGTSKVWTLAVFILECIHAIGLMIVFFSGFMYMDPYVSDFERTILFLAVPTFIFSELGKIFTKDLYSLKFSTWEACFSALQNGFNIASLVSLAFLALLIALVFLSYIVGRSQQKAGGHVKKDDREVENPFSKFYVAAGSALLVVLGLVALILHFVPYNWAWCADVVIEVSALAGYAYSLHRFRPRIEKSVYQLFDETDAIDEEELNDL